MANVQKDVRSCTQDVQLSRCRLERSSAGALSFLSIAGSVSIHPHTRQRDGQVGRNEHCNPKFRADEHASSSEKVGKVPFGI